jgi:hypothetical protein
MQTREKSRSRDKASPNLAAALHFFLSAARASIRVCPRQIHTIVQSVIIIIIKTCAASCGQSVT